MGSYQRVDIDDECMWFLGKNCYVQRETASFNFPLETDQLNIYYVVVVVVGCILRFMNVVA